MSRNFEHMVAGHRKDRIRGFLRKYVVLGRFLLRDDVEWLDYMIQGIFESKRYIFH